MIGRAFSMCFPDDQNVTFYAAGVSESTCTDQRDFGREQKRLEAHFDPERTLVYFSTTSNANTPYVRHKREMEGIVSDQPKYLILRLPTVAGRAANPHTLLNFLYSKISRSERFTLQKNARRRIIDVSDVVLLAERLLDDGVRNEAVNVAPPFDYGMPEIVAAFERVTGKSAIFDTVDSRAEATDVDTSRIDPMRQLFRQGSYLRATVEKYYG